MASEAKLQVDSVAKAHGVPTTMLPEDWTSTMYAFRLKFGKHIPEEKLPAQSYYEAFAERLAIGALKAEPLSMVVSAFEEEAQERNKPDPIRQYGISLDAKLTITTKKRIVSSEPVDEKTLREKYSIMTNMFLLAQMKQPGRAIYRDFDKCTFMDFLEKLLDKKNFNLHKEVNGSLPLVPKWSDCMSYEFEIRKEAFRMCREEGSSIKAALWATIENTEHRMIHWLQLISIANSRSSGSGGDYAALERKVLDLQREVRGRSRSPRNRNQNKKQKALPPPPQPLAIGDAQRQKRTDRAGRKGQNTRQNKAPQKGGKGSQQGGSSSSKDFNALMKAGPEVKDKFYANDGSICYQFNRKNCATNEKIARGISVTSVLAAERTPLTTIAYASTVSSTDRQHLFLTRSRIPRRNLLFP